MHLSIEMGIAFAMNMLYRKITPLLPVRVRMSVRNARSKFRGSYIISPTGALAPGTGGTTFILGVGASFDQTVPNAMMTARIGYCNGFEELGIPYIIADIREIDKIVQEVPNPVCMLFAGDLGRISKESIKHLRNVACLVWIYPWFRGSDQFFRQHGLDPAPWWLSAAVKRKILELGPAFGFTATMPSGLQFFEEWTRHGIPVHSLPLACDTRVYAPDSPDCPEFEAVQMAFVGGYWESKGKQIDKYLRPFENILTIYGYNRWPYGGYQGMLDRDKEASLYRQARVSPSINEPTVALLKGQINERVFKVLGSYGCTVVDAVPAYRELYSEDELPISEGPQHFAELVRTLLKDDGLREAYRSRGYKATLGRHTYRHRALTILRYLAIEAPSVDQTHSAGPG
jgi:hypothetical protein